jgi:hypothetical protein
MTARTAEASTVPQPTVPPGGPGLFHVKGLQLPPYVQHLYKHLVGRYGKQKAYGVAVGVVKKWAAGIHPGGKKKGGKQGHVHPDVQAAAARNVAEWEKDKAEGHRHSAEHANQGSQRGGKGALVKFAAPSFPRQLAPYGRSMLESQGRPRVPRDVFPPQPLGPGIYTAPGAKPFAYGMLQHEPSQTVSPSPPLPPGAVLPTAREILALAAVVNDERDVTMLAHTNSHLLAGAHMHLIAAAHKIETGDPPDTIGALAALRSAQMGIQDEWRWRVLGAKPWVAAVFDKTIPPAEQSSARVNADQHTAAARRMQAAMVQVTTLIDRVRRNYFRNLSGGAGLANQPNARL